MDTRPPPSLRERWLPHPALSVLLAASWLLLMHTLDPVQVVWAMLLGVAIPRLMRHLLPAASAVRLAPAVQLVGVVLWDIVVANVAVARLVLGPMARLRPAWVRVTLETSHPTAMAMLATIITTTPGTVSCVVDEERGEILVHALDCADPLAMAADIKARYERPLIAIFGPGNAERKTP